MAHLPTSPQTAATDQRWFWGLTLVAVVLWLIGLGGMPLRDWDEGTYGLLAREMVRSQDWLHLAIFGQPFWLKPPLAIWAMALGYGVMGGEGLGSPWLEFSLRFPLAIVSALGVPLLYCLSRELFRHQRQAIYPAVVYLTLLPVVRHGRLAMLDGIVNTAMILLFLCILKARKRPPWAIGIGLCLGTIALTKGVLVCAIGAIAGLYILLSQTYCLLRSPYAWVGLALGSALTGWWYWLQYHTYGFDFLTVHFGAQGFDRLATAVEGNEGPAWYYLLEILKYSWPWLVFFPLGLQQAGQQWRSWGLLALLGFWIFLAVVSGMGTKLPWYLFPCYPFLAVIVGGYFAAEPKPGRGYGYFFALLTVATAAGGIYLSVTDPQPPLLITAVVATLTFGTVAWGLLRSQNQAWRGDRLFIPLVVGLYGSLASFFCSQAWVWEVNEQFPVLPVAALVQAQTPPGAVVYTTHPLDRPSLNFYSDRPIQPRPWDTFATAWLTQTLPPEFLDSYWLIATPLLDSLPHPPTPIGQTDAWTLVYIQPSATGLND